MDCTWSDLLTALDGEPGLNIVEPFAVGDVIPLPEHGDVEDVIPLPLHGDVGDVIPGPLAVISGQLGNGDVLPDPQVPRINWETLQIEEKLDEEGRLEVIDDEQVYRLLGLREDEEQTATEAADDNGQSDGKQAESGKGPVMDDTIGATIPVDDDVPEERVFVHDPNKPCMDLGTVYPSMPEFRLAMRQFAINEEFELQIAKTDRTRYIGYCKGEGCPWHIVGRRQPDGKTVMVTVLIAAHTCTSSARRKTTTPTSAWVASKAVHIMQKKMLTTKELRERLQEEHKCEIHYDTIWKGRQKALKELHGSWEESFQLLFNWRAEVMKRSPGSIIEIDTKEVDGKVYFHRFFCALIPCIEGFKEGRRPYLSIDSSALNGRWNGHVAAATAIDGHNWMYPVAFGFIDGETTDNWTWFMRQLHKAIGDLPILAVSTDSCIGLETAVKAVFPQAEQRECFRHLMKNFVKRFGGDIFSKMYPAARAYRKEVFQYFFKQVTEASPDAKKWLATNHKLWWMRSKFNPEIKCDYITNNLAEVFNNWIKDFKDLPVHELADKFREMIMVLWNKRRLIGERLHGRILPAIIHQLKARTRGLGHLSVVKANCFSTEIWDSTSTHNRHVVKSYLHDCTCLEWQHTGKPCQHALALITAQQAVDVNMEDFVHEYYSIERFRKAYSRLIEPLPDKSQWPDVDLPFVVGAPLDKRLAGRQRKLRIKSCLEGGGGGKTKRDAKDAAQEVDKQAAAEVDNGKKQMIRGKRKCKRCGELGHGETSYKCPLNGTKKRKRKPRKNTTKYGENAKAPSKKRGKQQDTTAAVQNVEETCAADQNVEENAATGHVQECVVATSSPSRPNRESILQDSPVRVTRSRLAMLLEESTSEQTNIQRSPPSKLTPSKTKKHAKKMTPRKKKTI